MMISNLDKNTLLSTNHTTSWSGWKYDLNNCLLQSCLEDLRFTGSRITWSNQQCDNTILKKLDRVLLVNVQWNCDFIGSKTYFLPFGISSHSLMLVKLACLPKRKISFKFFNF
jgi:uncharacterized protein (DUF608 family)